MGLECHVALLSVHKYCGQIAQTEYIGRKIFSGQANGGCFLARPMDIVYKMDPDDASSRARPKSPDLRMVRTFTIGRALIVNKIDGAMIK